MKADTMDISKLAVKVVLISISYHFLSRLKKGAVSSACLAKRD